MSKLVALSCELVEVGRNYRQDRLARVVIVDEDGNLLLDRYCKPKENVTDFRQTFTSVTKLKLDSEGRDYDSVRAEVIELLKDDPIIVGHSLEVAFQALDYHPPENTVRDTAFKYQQGGGMFPGLKKLAKMKLNIDLGYAEAALNARTAMKIYLKSTF